MLLDLTLHSSAQRHPDKVALVCGGDPGVFAMAAAVCEQIESGPPAWRTLDVEIVPGVFVSSLTTADGWEPDPDVGGEMHELHHEGV